MFDVGSLFIILSFRLSFQNILKINDKDTFNELSDNVVDFYCVIDLAKSNSIHGIFAISALLPK